MPDVDALADYPFARDPPPEYMPPDPMAQFSGGRAEVLPPPGLPTAPGLPRQPPCPFINVIGPSAGIFVGTAMRIDSAYLVPDQPWGAYGSAIYRVETPEEHAERLANEINWYGRRQEQSAARREAEQVAEQLLRFYLTPEQCETLDRHGFIQTVGQETKRPYRIRRGRSMNVYCRDKERYYVYCVHPREDVPDPDTMLSQLLMITGDEQRFLREANRGSGWAEDWGSP